MNIVDVILAQLKAKLNTLDAAMEKALARAEAAEAQVAADTQTLKEVRARAEKAEKQLSVQLKANEELRERIVPLEYDNRTWEGACGIVKSERNALRARLEGLCVQIDSTVRALRNLARNDTDVLATDLKEALAAARGEGKVEPEPPPSPPYLDQAVRTVRAAWGPDAKIYEYSPGHISVDSNQPEGSGRRRCLTLHGPRERTDCYRMIVAAVEACPIPPEAPAEPHPLTREEEELTGEEHTEEMYEQEQHSGDMGPYHLSTAYLAESTPLTQEEAERRVQARLPGAKVLLLHAPGKWRGVVTIDTEARGLKVEAKAVYEEMVLAALVAAVEAMPAQGEESRE